MSGDQKPVGVLYFEGSGARRRGILYYLSYAAGLHALFFGLTAMMRPSPPEVPPRSPTIITVDDPVVAVESPLPEVKPAAAEPVKLEPLKAEPAKAESRLSPSSERRGPSQRDTAETPSNKFPPASAPLGEAHGVDKDLESLEGSNPILTGEPRRHVHMPGDDILPAQTPSIGEASRRQRRGSLLSGDDADTEANGPRGVGTVWGGRKRGPLHLSRRNIWGDSAKKALKGTLCFISPGTRSLVSLQRCVAEGSFYTDKLNIPKQRFTQGFSGISERFEWFAINYNGNFTVSQSGKYVFRIASDDGSLVWVDSRLLLNNDGLHPVQSRANAIFLSEGSHTLRLLYYQGPRVDVALQLFVTPPGSTERLWGPKL